MYETKRAVRSGVMTGLVLALTLAISRATFGAEPTPADLEFFEKEIRPLLVEHCLQCHSPEKKVRGGLRLDHPEGWLKGGDSGPAVVPGNVDDSLLIEAIRYSNDDMQMPPKGKLSAESIAVLEDWVKRGAPAPKPTVSPTANTAPAVLDLVKAREFWSYRPRFRPTVPEDQTGQPIDRFLATGLHAAGLKPNPEADRAVLIRRLTYDLHGLPPTPAEIDAFLADSSPDAYQKLVERLLASPRYGERFGRHWLDLVRYAESLTLRGFLLPNAWRYRDYVVESFQADRPYDQFLREQVAGDLLPAATIADRQRQLVATTFWAMGDTNLEEQDKKQMEMDIVDEQLDTFGKAILGQTIGCARCHDHKFDPIPTRDYYALAGILHSGQMVEHSNVSALKQVPLPQPPEVEQAWQEQNAALAALQREATELKAQIAALDKGEGPGNRGALVVATADLPGIVVDDTQAKKVGFWQDSQFSKRYIGEGYTHDQNGAKGAKTLSFIPQLKQNGRYEVRFAWTPGGNRAAKVPVTVFSADGEKTIEVNQQQTPPIDGRWISLGVYACEATGQSFVIVSNAETEGHVVADAVQFLPVDADGRPIVEPRPAPVGASTAKPSDAPTPAKPIESPELIAKRQQAKDVEARLKELKSKIDRRPHVLTMVERKEAADCPIHVRGSVHTLGEVVPRGFLQVVTYSPLPTLPTDQSGRVELAHWLTDPANPLPARVMANRLWHWLFASGIVRTTDNFGTTGETPANPELLEYLASRLVDSGWSIKSLVREIVLSEAYRRSSLDDPAGLERDPENRLLWRMNRKRLEAECLRDAMLTLSGTLRLDAGGSDIPESRSSDYGFVDEQTRRSVYVPVFRNALPGLFQTFDFADPGLVVGRRNVSTVAPQALFLMNDPFVANQARLAANQLLAQPLPTGISEAEGVTWRLGSLYRSALGRGPLDSEQRSSLAYLAQTPGEPADRWARLVQVLFASLDFRYRD
jgi:hypothetical protein